MRLVWDRIGLTPDAFFMRFVLGEPLHLRSPRDLLAIGGGQYLKYDRMKIGDGELEREVV